MSDRVDQSQPGILLETKVHPPRLTANYVERPRLLAQLDGGVDHWLTLVSAPAGYGKTMLILSWLQQQAEPVAWLSLNESDNDPVTFLSYLVAAIRTVFPSACPEMEHVLQAAPLPLPDLIASVLINEIGALPLAPPATNLTLIIDDYHYIRDESIHRIMSRLIEHKPKMFRLFLISREDPFLLPLHRLRAQQQITDIRRADLRFSIDETQTYLAKASGLTISDEVVRGLDHQIEGWIVGLSLASLSVRDDDDPAAFMRGLAGTDRYIMEYMVEEVLARQPESVRSFLLSTSILDRFCASLCKAIVDIDDGDRSAHSYLSWLEQTNTFLISLDTQQTWYRYHNLFQEMLASRLQGECDPAQILDLHRRASQWFAQHGYVEESLHHALLGQDTQAAVLLVEENCHDLLNRLAWTTIEKWLSLLPDDVVWQRPRLLMMLAWLHYRQWRLNTLDSIVDGALHCLNFDTELSPPEKRALLGQFNTFRTVTSYLLHADPEYTIALAEEALAQLPPNEGGALGTIHSYLALARLNIGQKDVAVQQLKTALDDPSPYGPARVQLYLGLAYVQLNGGDLHQMLQTTQLALALAEKVPYSVRGVAAHLIAGMLQYEWNNLAAAREHFNAVVELRFQGNFYATFTCLLGLIKMQQTAGDLERAQSTLSELRTDTMRLHNSYVLPQLDSMQATQWLLVGASDRAHHWARTMDPGTQREDPLFFDLPSLAQARILAAHGTIDEVEQCAADLQRALQEAEAQFFTRRVIQLLIHLALLYQGSDRDAAAREALGRAVDLGQTGAFIRAFVECGTPLAPLLIDLKHRGAHSGYVSDLLTAVRQPGGQSATNEVQSTARLPVDPLTRREEEVLRLMQAGLTNKEIAQELVISALTVKTHASNLYSKLNVENRRQAVRRALQMGLLS